MTNISLRNKKEADLSPQWKNGKSNLTILNFVFMTNFAVNRSKVQSKHI
jgi:hypothetical protein